MKAKFVRTTIFVAVLVMIPILLVGSSSGNISNRVTTGIAVIDNYINGFGVFAQHNHIPIDFGTATHTAVQSGNWSDTATWGGSLPSENAIVSIPMGTTVTVDNVFTAKMKLVTIDGELKFATNVNTELWVDTLVSNMTGRLEIGTSANPVANDVTARIVFADLGAIDRNQDPKQLSRGAILAGPVVAYGAEATHRMTLAAHPSAGATTLELSSVPTNWKVGDELIVTGTQGPKSDEVRAISNMNGTTVTLNQALALDHVAPYGDLNVYVANTTRNVIFASENSEIARRGHIMFMHSLNVDVNNVAFQNLGRTDKSIQLNDIEFIFDENSPGNATSAGVDFTTQTGPSTNIRGRYAVHVHRGGTDPNSTPALIKGSVVMGSPGWGFVNHSSNVNFINNVAYGVQGAAFYTEAGDEIGTMEGNIAIRTINPNFTLDHDGGAIDPDLEAEQQSFGTTGDGFWLSGTRVSVINNVSAGASAHGIIFWTDGLVEPDLGRSTVQVSTLPNGHLIPDRETVPVWWAPLAEVKDNESYSAVIGFRSRYIHAHTYLAPVNSPFHAAPPQAYIDTLNPIFDGITVWASRDGLVINYNERLSVRNARLIGIGETFQHNLFATAAIGVGLDLNNEVTRGPGFVENVTIEGYEMGFIAPRHDTWTIDNLTLSNVTDMLVHLPRQSPRTMTMNNIVFGSLDGTAVAGRDGERRNIVMEPHYEAVGGQPYYFALTDRITLDGQGIYFNEQGADQVPLQSEESVEESVGSSYIGITNQQMLDTYGYSAGGALIPGDAQSVSYITNGVIGSAASTPAVTPPLFDIQEGIDGGDEDGEGDEGTNDDEDPDEDGNDANEEGNDTEDTDEDNEEDDEGTHGEDDLYEWLEIAAQTINVTIESLLESIQSGQTIAQVAQENSVDPQAIIDAIVSTEVATIDELISEGEIDEEEGNEWKAEVAEEASNFVTEILDECDDKKPGVDSGETDEEDVDDEGTDGAGDETEDEGDDDASDETDGTVSGTNKFPTNATILLLGDSRVEGARPDYESYRYELWKNLLDNGWTFDFVGTRQDDDSYPTYQGQSFDIDHEGIGGATTGDLLGEIDSVLASVGAPNIALIGIGGNDLTDEVQSIADIADVISNISQLIDKLQTSNANITIFVEQIAPGSATFMSPEYQAALDEFNKGIATLASQQRDSKSNVIVVDMVTGWSDSYLADEVHYNEVGAKSVADRYDTAMDAFFGDTGQPSEDEGDDAQSDDLGDTSEDEGTGENGTGGDNANDEGADEGTDEDDAANEGADDEGTDNESADDEGTDDEGTDNESVDEDSTDEDDAADEGAADEGTDEDGTEDSTDEDSADEGTEEDDTDDGGANEQVDEDINYIDAAGNWFWFYIVVHKLNVDADTIWTALAEGQSLAELAEANGSNAQALMDAIVTAETEMVESALAMGLLTEEVADEWLAELDEAATEMVNTTYDGSNDNESGEDDDTDESAGLGDTGNSNAGDSVVPNTSATRRPLDVNEVPAAHSLTENLAANDSGDDNSSITHMVFLPVVKR